MTLTNHAYFTAFKRRIPGLLLGSLGTAVVGGEMRGLTTAIPKEAVPIESLRTSFSKINPCEEP
jgi:hypothetical protein